MSQKRLENLIGNSWKFTGEKKEASIEFGELTDKAVPSFFIRDSGAGFDFSAKSNTDKEASISSHGRGMFLLEEICDSIEYQGSGNRVEAVYTWSVEK